MPLTSTDAPLEIRAAEAVRAYLAQVTGLTTTTFRRADDPRERPLPIAVVAVENLRQSWTGSDEFEGILTVAYDSGRLPDADADSITGEDTDRLANQTSHHAITAKIATALADQLAIRTYINARAVTGGTFTLTDSEGTVSAALAWTITANAVQQAIVGFDGFSACTVSGNAGGPWRITRGSVGAVALTGSGASLTPASSQVSILPEEPGDATTSARWLVSLDAAAARPATSLHIYKVLDHEEPGTVQDGDNWSTVFRRRIICARVDYLD